MRRCPAPLRSSHPSGQCDNLSQVTALLLEPTWQQWAADTQAVGAALPGALEAPLQAAQQLLVTFERWLLQLKALRRMVMFGFPPDARSLAQVGSADAPLPGRHSLACCPVGPCFCLLGLRSSFEWFGKAARFLVMCVIACAVPASPCQVPAVGQVVPPLLATLRQFTAARAARSASAQRNQVQVGLSAFPALVVPKSAEKRRLIMNRCTRLLCACHLPCSYSTHACACIPPTPAPIPLDGRPCWTAPS